LRSRSFEIECLRLWKNCDFCWGSMRRAAYV
jgi:hypothetical protein